MTRWPVMERANLGAGDTRKWAGTAAGTLTVDGAPGGSFRREVKRAAERASRSGGHRLTVRSMAGRLGVSTATANKLVAQGGLPHIRVANAIRIAPDEFGALIARLRGETDPWRRGST